MSEKFPVLAVTDWKISAEEPAGLDEKYWLLNPETSEKWLFKPAVEKHGFRQREDYSEKISAHLATRLNIPCADVELAIRDGRPGNLSKNLRPNGWSLQPGAILLSEFNPNYVRGAEKPKGRPGHSLRAIQEALAGVERPPDVNLPPDFTAFDVFAGYMLLDAWIANRDRHDENWAVLVPGPPHHLDERKRLCGTYDLAGGLGYNVSDERCDRLLQDANGVAKWVGDGTAHRFEHVPPKPETLVALAAKALSMASGAAKTYWLEHVMQITESDLTQMVDHAPNLSVACRTFAIEVLRINQRRVLDACS